MYSVLTEIYEIEKNTYCLTYESDGKADAFSERNIGIVIDDGTYGGECKQWVKPGKTIEVKLHEKGYEVIAADISWTEANAEAIRRGGHLITITSQEEMDTAVKLAEEKNLEFVITAFAKHIKKSDNIQLLIVGDGSETNYLKGLCKTLKVNDTVFFSGSVANSIMPDIFLLHHINLFLLLFVHMVYLLRN